MYRQPENNNRVKYMKNRFERLDSEKNNRNDLKLTKINNKTNEKNINNNDYKHNRLQNTHDNTLIVGDQENVEIKNGPPLNLTRQLSDPSKKGCIKRTPAFRKEKFVNSRLKAQNELSFAGKVSLFEEKDRLVCDNDKIKEKCTNQEKKKLTSSVSLVLTKPQNISQKRASLSPKRVTTPKTSPVSLPKNKSSLYNVKKNPLVDELSKRTSLSSVGSSGSDFGSPPKANSSFLTVYKDSVQKSPRSSKLKSAGNRSPLTKDKNFKDKATPPKSPNFTQKIPVKIRDKPKSEDKSTFATTRKTSVSFIKEMLDNETNKDFEEKLEKTIPEYAQVNKTKRKEKSNTDSLTDTLKAALKQPLPAGPPPKKPPRTFAHTVNIEIAKTPSATYAEIDEKIESPKQVEKLNLETVFCEKLNTNLAQAIKRPEEPKPKIKSDPKLMLQKLENALLNNKIRSPKLPKKIKSTLETSKLQSNLVTSSPSSSNQYTIEPNSFSTPPKNIFPNCLQSLNCTNPTRNSYSRLSTLDSKSTFFIPEKKQEEPIYAEPFEYQVLETNGDSVDSGMSTISRSVHYLSSPVSSQPWLDVSPSSTNPESVLSDDKVGEKLNKHKLNLIMNHTYASLNPSDSEDMDSSSSSPTFETPPCTIRQNSIRDIIASFEDIKQKLNHQYSSNALIKTNQEPGSNQINRLRSDSTDSDEKDFVADLKSGSENCADVNNDEFYNQKKKVKAELSRTLTEIRKNYVRRVCSTVRRKKEKELDESPHLFECCLLVELNVSTLTPYVKGKFPPDYEVPPWVEHLCYPDASDWVPETIQSTTTNPNLASQCYSLVITNEKGERKFGYCRRVLPEEACVCLPLTYCIISTFRAPGFYYKVLQELESRHGLPHWLQNAFLQELYNSKFPRPGHNVKISCLLRVLLVNSCEKLNDNRNGEYGKINKKSDSKEELDKEWVVCDRLSSDEYNEEMQKDIYTILNKMRLNKSEFTKIDDYVKEFHKKSTRKSSTVDEELQNNPPESNTVQVCTKTVYKSESTTVDDTDTNSCTLMLNLPNNQLIHDCLLGDVTFRRPYDHRIEDTDLTVLFETLNLNVLLQTFGSLLVERKVVFVSKCLSQLSSCVEAMQSILYPFSWQHTFIPVLSNNMLDILSAPLPLVAGVLASHLNEDLILEDGIAVNLDTSVVISSMGDEPGILPKRLRNGLSLALQLVSTASSVDGSRNVLVSEAFMRMFVEVCGHYRNYIVMNEKEEKTFDREGFIKQHNSKSAQMFLEWFTETAMFHVFIQSKLENIDDDNIFEQRCVELQNEKQKNKGMKRMKNFFKT